MSMASTRFIDRKASMAKNNNNGKVIHSQAAMNKAIKSICDILRRDKAKGARLYVPELTWMFFLRYLDLPDTAKFHESDLEQAIIDNLQHFLLELGKGFSFVARQKQMRFGDEDFYVDLVFYNFILKCFLLIDLKIGKLTHQDIGQMDGYVRMYEEHGKVEGDNPTIGLILCSEKNEAIARYSVLNDSKQLFVSKYMLYLPTEEELQRELERERRLIEERQQAGDEGDQNSD
jgi:predicted nuclease of restriction endonuclease-like (RecB) superfamily